MQKKGTHISQTAVADRIRFLRGQRVVLDEVLAQLFGVTTKRLNEQIKRNQNRFPPDFMFQLSDEEVTTLRSQFATSRATDIAYSFATQDSLHTSNPILPLSL